VTIAATEATITTSTTARGIVRIADIALPLPYAPSTGKKSGTISLTYPGDEWTAKLSQPRNSCRGRCGAASPESVRRLDASR
jgi:hypothetical protein